jgi:hypothetical protein
LSWVFFRGVTLTAHTTSFAIVLQPLAIGFEPSQKNLLVVGDVHCGMTTSLMVFSFFSSRVCLFFELIIVKCFFYDSFAIVAYNLNQIIRLPDLIGFSQVNDPSFEFFLLI